MSSSSTRICPHVECGRAIVVSTHAEMAAGLPLWRCAAGHRGPLLVGFSGDGD